MDKRAARNEYKSKKTPKGIYAVRCTATAGVWVGSSTHLDSQRNQIWFVLRSGRHDHASMQAAWNAHGENTFVYEILQTLDDDTPPLLLRDLLENRRRHWEQALRTETNLAAPVSNPPGYPPKSTP